MKSFLLMSFVITTLSGNSFASELRQGNLKKIEETVLREKPNLDAGMFRIDSLSGKISGMPEEIDSPGIALALQRAGKVKVEEGSTLRMGVPVKVSSAKVSIFKTVKWAMKEIFEVIDRNPDEAELIHSSKNLRDTLQREILGLLRSETAAKLMIANYVIDSGKRVSDEGRLLIAVSEENQEYTIVHFASGRD